MSVKNYISVDWFSDPRIIRIADAGEESKELVLQDLADSAWDIEEKNYSMGFPHLIDGSGKEPLGGEVFVGITITLKNTKIEFQARTTPRSVGTATSDDGTGTVLIDTGATFEDDAVEVGALIVNFTDMSVATVRSIDSQNQITHDVLVEGTNNDWNIGDDYKIWNIVQCEVSGGNITAVDDLGAEMKAIFPTAFTQIVRTSSSSATLQELEDVQYASFDGGVSLDPMNGNDDNKGNTEFPVKTLTRAQEIAVGRGFDSIHVHGDLTLGATDDVRNYNLDGRAPNKDTVTIISGCLTNKVHFNNISVTGDLDGADADFDNCVVGNVTGVTGLLRNCLMHGSIGLAGTSVTIVTFVECYLGTTQLGLVEIDMGNDGPALAMRAYTGGVKLTNKTGTAKVAIDFISGRLELMSSVTAGTFFVRGVGEITVNEATGISLNDDPLINPAVVADAVLEESLGDHKNEAGSLAETLYLSRGVLGGALKLTDDDGGTMYIYDDDNLTEIARFATWKNEEMTIRTHVPKDIVARSRIPIP